MAGDVKIEQSQIITGSRVTHSRISNVTSRPTATMTPEMWHTVFRLVDMYGRSREIEGARELRLLLERGRRLDAKPVWERLRSFLGDFANVSKIVEALDTLVR